MKHVIAALTLVLASAVWGCGSTERPRGTGGSGGGSDGGSGGSVATTGGTGGSSKGGSGGGGSPGTGGSIGTGGSTGGSSGGNDASADGSPAAKLDGAAMSGGELWAKCGPEAFKPDVSAADLCARYISVCKATVSMDACVSMYNGISPGPRHCQACTAYYACIASAPEVMAMSCMYISQGLAKAGPCKPSYCD
jgi:hypothetical protein